MSTEDNQYKTEHKLNMCIYEKNLSVSYISSLLRTLQAAIREIAISDVDVQNFFNEEKKPALVISNLAFQDAFELEMIFIDGVERKFNENLSRYVFDKFVVEFISFVRTLPQPGLWGDASSKSWDSKTKSDVEIRMYQIYRELKRCTKVIIKSGAKKIEIDGERLQLG
jgi:hypothetical protein